jgi:SAM-dependent methyltransferase
MGNRPGADAAAVTTSRAISPADRMFEAGGRNLEGYLKVGRQALALLKRHSDSPSRILDFGCGHGRVLRHIVAEWPEADVWACDIDREAVEFCEQEFGVRGIQSASDAQEVTLPRCDLIWAGSVFTHLPQPVWRDFLRLLANTLDGTLVFTLEGPFVAECMRGGEEMGTAHETPGLLADFDATGFGYRDWPHAKQKGYGVAVVSPERASLELEAVGLRMSGYEPQGWIARQDVVVARR